ncbi:unnamed protein product [Paramecium pentaurelia]|uniref:LMBR1-like motif protein n=1 Tax=Paramecium pentaurelia TaxID=43138 RepID=A0A8S1VNM1_9CILI|nr:unnamed protein product [Paramecium pentaurelia]
MLTEDVVFYSIATTILLIYVLYLIWEYSAKDVPLYIKILTFISWTLTFSIVLVLPIDIANSTKQVNETQQLETMGNIKILWRIMYWGNFFLAWLVLPFFQDYEGSGDFDVRGKIRYSLKKNLTIYGVGTIIIVGLAIYLLIKDNFDSTHVEGVLIGVSNFFGLLLVVILLGQGLVAIPKLYYREHKEEEVLEQCYQQAVLLDEQRTEKTYELEDICRVTLQLLQNEHSDSEFSRYLMIILQKIPQEFQKSIRQTLQKYNASNIPDKYKPLNLEVLASIHKYIKCLMFDLQRIQTKLNIVNQKALKFERKDLADDETQFETKWSKMIYKISIIWNLKLRKYYCVVLAITYALLSLFILFCELITFVAKTNKELNPYYLLLSSINRYYLTELILLLPLLYMMFCTYYGLFAMKISGLISFNKHHHTDAPSLMFGSINFARVSFPLCFNFIQITDILEDQTTSFSETVGNLAESLFVQSYKTILPLMLLIMCFFNLFNIGDKLMRTIGLGQYAQQERIQGMSLEGKKIIEKERELRKKNNLNDSNSQIVFQELQIMPKNKIQDEEDTSRKNSQNQGIRNFDQILSI